MPGSGAALSAPQGCGLPLCSDAPHPPVQDMGAGLAVVPLVGVLETVAIAKAFGTAAVGRRGPCGGLGTEGASLFPWGLCAECSELCSSPCSLTERLQDRCQPGAAGHG